MKKSGKVKNCVSWNGLRQNRLSGKYVQIGCQIFWLNITNKTKWLQDRHFSYFIKTKEMIFSAILWRLIKHGYQPYTWEYVTIHTSISHKLIINIEIQNPNISPKSHFLGYEKGNHLPQLKPQPSNINAATHCKTLEKLHQGYSVQTEKNFNMEVCLMPIWTLLWHKRTVSVLYVGSLLRRIFADNDEIQEAAKIHWKSGGRETSTMFE